jgi:predicted component of type VI protein secretion system
MMRRNTQATAGFLLLALLVAGCASLDANRTIHATNQGVTVVLTTTDAALNAHRISSKQAAAVSSVAHQIVPLLDSAKAASDAGDKAGANRALKLADQLLAALDAYVPPAK